MADVLDYGDPADAADVGGSNDTDMSRAGLTNDSTYGGDVASWQNSYDDNFGSADGVDRPLLDDAIEAEMQAWEASYNGLPDEYDMRREAKLTELLAARRQGGSRFYALPRDEAVRAGAQRGVASVDSQKANLDEEQLMGNAAADNDSPAPEMPQTIGQGLDVRFAVLHMQGMPITQCSTSRLFAYVTHFGAQPLGLEWVNDSSCNIVFSDANAARIAIEYLCPPTNMSTEPLVPLPNDRELDEAAQIKKMHDSGEDTERTQEFEWPETLMQSLLMPRKAHRFPAKLYNAPERDAAFELAQHAKEAMSSQLPDDVPEIYREMEMEDHNRQMQDPKQKALQSLRSNLWLRWAVESLDVKGSDAARRSKWYREHGRDAGREVVPKMLEVGGVQDRLELLPSDGRRNRRGRGAKDSTAAMDALDRELDTWREGGQEIIHDRWNDRGPRGRSHRKRNNDAGRDGGMISAEEDLEMAADEHFANRGRSASPSRRDPMAYTSAGNGNQVRVRGRGKMRAPSAWDDDASSAGRDRMLADDIERRDAGRHHGRRRGRGRHNDSSGATLEGRLDHDGPSLASRFGPSSLKDRMT